jgi:ATP-dependent DNA ligase
MVGGLDGVLRPPLLVMSAKPAEELPTGGRWWWEPKLDGFRALAFRDRAGRVRLQSRQQRDLTRGSVLRASVPSTRSSSRASASLLVTA